MNTKDFYPTNFTPSGWLKSENEASSAAAPSASGVASPASREDDAQGPYWGPASRVFKIEKKSDVKSVRFSGLPGYWYLMLKVGK